MRQANKRSSGALRMVLTVVLIVILAVSAYMIISQLLRERKEAKAFQDLIALIDNGDGGSQSTESTGTDPRPQDGAGESSGSGQDPAPGADSVSDTDAEPEGFHKYDLLYEQNHDMFGWVKIDGTKLDYPVMLTPDEPERYIRRAFDETYSSSGVPFMEEDCYEGCGNYIAYGHHMKNGTMFAALMEYANEEFWREHPVIHFDTIHEPGEYEVMSAFYGKVYNVDDTGVFRYYNYTDLTDEDTFNEYVSKVKKLSRYDTGVTAEYGDQLITLITCSYHTDEGRFVVVARKTAADSQASE